MSTNATPAPGQMLGRYRLTAELGRGAMGQVFLAEDTTLQQSVCVKLLHPQFLHHPEALARFTRELVLARRIAHPGVCRVFDLHDEAGQRFLTMEYIEGAPLKSLVGTRIPVERALQITKHLCEALAAAHDKGVVHRDLKPGNIMLRAGSDDDVCILDFGIAAADDTAAQGLTRPGVALGTRLYIAPEVWAGQPATARSDLFAVGVILFRLLTGAWPWGTEDLAIFERQRTLPPTKPSTLRPDVPAVVDALVASALAVNPAARIESARAFAAACDDVLRQLAPSSLVPSSFAAAATLVGPRPVSLGPATEVAPSSFAAAPSITDPLPEQATAALSTPLHSSDEASWVVSGRPVNAPVRPKVMAVKPAVPTNSGTELVVRPGRSSGAGTRRLVALVVVTAATVAVAGVVIVRGGAEQSAPIAATDAGAGVAVATPPPSSTVTPDIVAAADVVDAGGLATSPTPPVTPPLSTKLERGPGGEVGAPEIAPDTAPAPVKTTTASTKAQRVAADRALRDVTAAMRARGLVPGDDSELDRTRDAARRAAKARRYDAAIAGADNAIARVAAVRVDRDLVVKKLTRLNGHFDREKNATKRAKLDDLAGRASTELAAGRVDAANRALNEGFALLGKDH